MRLGKLPITRVMEFIQRTECLGMYVSWGLMELNHPSLLCVQILLRLVSSIRRIASLDNMRPMTLNADDRHARREFRRQASSVCHSMQSQYEHTAFITCSTIYSKRITYEYLSAINMICKVVWLFIEIGFDRCLLVIDLLDTRSCPKHWNNSTILSKLWSYHAQ